MKKTSIARSLINNKQSITIPRVSALAPIYLLSQCTKEVHLLMLIGDLGGKYNNVCL